MNRREINAIKAELGAYNPHPDGSNSVPLPPQPSILPGGYSDTMSERAARKLNKIANKLGPAKKIAGKILRFRPKKYIDNFNRFPRRHLSTVSFKPVNNPEVSIIIPVFNKLELTYNCLKSLQENVSESIQYEVVVVDNNSTDKSHLLANVRGLKYIRNAENMGFVEGCNIGAENSKGEYVVFLNNDAMVTPDWLESLLRTIKSSETIGLVGSKILYPDGRLQEAGGVIFKDGSGSNYGKFDHPDRYQYNYLREVDYCSGASIIIEKKLFDSFGGFDLLYAPAYYEDTDLAFKVRDHGLRVMYQPESVIYHIEGATAGTSTSSGFKKYQAINRVKFIKRWRKTLQADHLSEKDLYLARDRSYKKTALIVDEFLPRPDKDSGSVRMLRMIKLLQELDYKITFFPNHLAKDGKYTTNLEQMGVEVVYGPATFSKFIEQYGKFYDLVILSRPRIGTSFLELCQAYCTKAKIIYDTVDLHFLRLGRQVQYEEGEMKKYYEDMAKKHEIIEKDLINNSDVALVVSKIEADLLQKDGFDNVRVLSNIHEINDSAYDIGFDKRKDLLFIGGYDHLPNQDAVQWFADKILPSIVKKIPTIKLHVVGSNLPEEIRKHLQLNKAVIIDGYVEDVSDLFKSARVFVAPLRYGAGVKGKVGQAIEYGVPVVSTSIGSEGMYLTNNESVLIADEVTDFANKVISLYKDSKTWNKLRSEAKKSLRTHFSLEAAKRDLETALKD